MSRPFLLLAYQAATALIEPIAPMLLRRRAVRGKEEVARLGERLGQAGAPRPDGPLAWLHGVSVGEALSVLSLAEALRASRPDLNLLLTSSTQTSAAVLAQRLPPGAIHQYAPIDGPRAVGRFLDHWRPDLAVFAESELWPNLLVQARANGARTVLVSAKLSEASARGWSFAPGMARALLGGYELLLAQDERAAARLEAFGVRVDGLADLKFGAGPLPADAAQLEAVRAPLAGRPIVLAASTHPGEDEIVLDRFRALLEAPEVAAATPLLVIVPRHPERGPAIAGLARERRLSASLQSAGEAAGGGQVHVADALGELGLWYRLARLAVVGGSLCEGLAGHNPLEPARLLCPFISGPHVANWTTAYAELEQAEGTVIVEPGPALDDWFQAAIAGAPNLAAMADRALTHVDRKDEEVHAVPRRILGLLA
jgi:3-deoxy-D-manno-octulosonic-acid transferase